MNDLYKDVDIEISEADLQAMAQELAAGYLSYAQEKGYADVTKMGENFAAYLGTADGKQRLSNGLSETLDMKSLESQLSSGMNAYMKQAMRAYAKSFGNALETQISSAMEQIIGQMSSGMGKSNGICHDTDRTESPECHARCDEDRYRCICKGISVQYDGG